MFALIRQWRRRRRLRRGLVGAAPWQRALGALPMLRGLDEAELERLRRLTTHFLAEKTFEPVQGLSLDENDRVFIAAQACLPILELGIDWYEGWSALIIYPDLFIPAHETRDEAGVVHVQRRRLSGESWERGPIVLSWPDVRASGQGAGHSVLIHELAHKLDALNGRINGFPPPHRGMQAEAWSEAFNEAFEALGEDVRAGRDTPVDPYAAYNAGECFAVFSEYFFDSPWVLREHYPKAYAQLSLFYRQDPARRLPPP